MILNISKDVREKLNESENTKFSVDPQKVLVVKNFLDKNFKRAVIARMDNNGYPKSTPIVGMIGTDGAVVKNMSDSQLYNLLVDKFKNIYSDKEKRNAFLKQVLIDWYGKRISNQGLLSKNLFESRKPTLLTEGSVDKFIEKTIRAKYPQLNEYFDKPLNEMPQRFKDEFRRMDQTMWDKSQNLKFIDFLRIELAKAFDITGGRGPKKFLRGIARIAIGNLDFFGRNSNQSTLTKFKNIVLHIFKNDPDKFDSDLNGLTYEQLSEAYNDVMKQSHASLVGTMNKMKLGKSNYTVVAIHSAQEAQQYKDYTSWCITQPGISESNYERYVSGGRRFYFLLQDGFENIPQQTSDGCPFDTYGKSMISLAISMDGSVDLLTTRWNHANNGEISSPDDDVLKLVQKFTGVHIFDACKPYTRDELRKMGVIPFEDVPEMLAQGVDPNEIFDEIYNFSEGFASVRLNDKYNSINQEGKLVSNQWFDAVVDFREGFVRVKLNGKWNLINTKGNLLSNQWFDYIGNFHEGFALVKLNDKYNYINTEGKLLSNQWFDDAVYFLGGFARVELNGKRYKIGTEGNLYSLHGRKISTSINEGFIRKAVRESIKKILKEN